MFYKKGVVKNFAKLTEKTCARETRPCCLVTDDVIIHGHLKKFFLQNSSCISINQWLFSCWVVFNKQSYPQNARYRRYRAKCMVLQLTAVINATATKNVQNIMQLDKSWKPGGCYIIVQFPGSQFLCQKYEEKTMISLIYWWFTLCNDKGSTLRCT